MILLNSTDSLQVLLGGAVTTNQAVLYASFDDMKADGSTFAPKSSNGLTNSTTAVSWVGSPASGDVRQIKYLSLFNADTASITATVRVNDGTNTRIIGKFTLATGERVGYTVDHGFLTFDVNGLAKDASAVTSVNGQTGAVTIPLKQFDGMALSDLATVLTTTTNAGAWIVPCNCTLNEVFTGLVAAQSSSGAVTVDAKRSGTSIFSTLPSIDASESTNLTGTAAVLSTTSFSKGDIVIFSITAAGTGAKGLQVQYAYTPT